MVLSLNQLSHYWGQVGFLALMPFVIHQIFIAL